MRPGIRNVDTWPSEDFSSQGRGDANREALNKAEDSLIYFYLMNFCITILILHNKNDYFFIK